jgi:hypothetical protein
MTNFEHDIFISYTHLDNESPFIGENGWISNFSFALKVRVGQLLGRKPRLWRDPELQGNEFFDEALIEQVSRAAVLVAVLSPRYIESDWCLRELETFLHSAESTTGLQINGKARIFKIIKTPLPLEKHPFSLGRLLGYSFLETDPDTGRERELDPVFGPKARDKLMPRIDDLAYEICDVLRALCGQRPAPVADKTVYLAPASFDLEESYNAIKRDLRRRGYHVLPDRPLPTAALPLQTQVREQLARSQLAVHLIGENYGWVPDGSTESIVGLQHQLALEQQRADFFQLIWVAPALKVSDERQRGFIERLYSDPRISRNTDFLEGSVEDLKSEIYRHLEQKPQTPVASEDQLTRIYLVCDRADEAAIGELKNYLFNYHQNFEVITPLFSDDEAEVRQEHEYNLQHCDALVIYYGAGSELWLHRKISELRKSAAHRAIPLAVRAIYAASAAKKCPQTREAVLLQQPESGFGEAVLHPLMAQLVNLQTRYAG